MEAVSETAAARAAPPAASEAASSEAEPIGRRSWRDLLVAGLWIAVTAFSAAAPPLIRVPIGLVAVLYLPGYLLSSIVLPSENDLDRVGRVGMSLGLSPAIISLAALILDRSGIGIRLEVLPIAVTCVDAVLLVVAVARRRVAPVEPPEPGSRTPFVGRAARFTQALVIANVLAAALAYVLAASQPGTPPTEFYILGPEQRLAGYPRAVAVGEAIVVSAGIHQEAGRAGSYRINVQQGDNVLATVGPVQVPAGGRWDETVSIPMETVGDDQELTFALLRDADPVPYRNLRLRVDVVPSGVRP